MQKEAKYMQKRPNNSNETRYCLTNDDTDLRVTICHIRWEIGLNRSSHFDVQRVFSVVVAIATAKPEVD
jgi:hypothetical protein